MGPKYKNDCAGEGQQPAEVALCVDPLWPPVLLVPVSNVYLLFSGDYIFAFCEPDKSFFLQYRILVNAD
jgi:hypothetical protein